MNRVCPQSGRPGYFYHEGLSWKHGNAADLFRKTGHTGATGISRQGPAVLAKTWPLPPLGYYHGNNT